MEISEEALESVLREWERRAPTDAEVEAFLDGDLDRAMPRPAGYVHPALETPPHPAAVTPRSALAPPEEAAWVPVEGSSNVAEAAYWHHPTPGATGTLGMRFLNGGEYHYPGVPFYLYRALSGARSKGKAHWELIRRRGYLAIRVVPPRKNWRRT